MNLIEYTAHFSTKKSDLHQDLVEEYLKLINRGRTHDEAIREMLRTYRKHTISSLSRTLVIGIVDYLKLNKVRKNFKSLDTVGKLEAALISLLSVVGVYSGVIKSIKGAVTVRAIKKLDKELKSMKK
jgi:hypothetical protein